MIASTQRRSLLHRMEEARRQTQRQLDMIDRQITRRMTALIPQLGRKRSGYRRGAGPEPISGALPCVAGGASVRAPAGDRRALAEARPAGSRHCRAERTARNHGGRATTPTHSPRRYRCGACTMRFRCRRCGLSWPDHPVTRVACPTCRAVPGAWCRRPSGYRAAELHVDREHAALAIGVLQTCRPFGRPLIGG